MSEKVTVYDRATGAPLLRWPVDARELMTMGVASAVPVAVEHVADPVAETKPVVDEPEAAHTSRPRRRR